MSTEYTSYAVIGITIPVSLMEGGRTITRTPNCSHPERDGKVFCPTCGKEVRDNVTSRTNFDTYTRCEQLQKALDAGHCDTAVMGGSPWVVTYENEHFDKIVVGTGLSCYQYDTYKTVKLPQDVSNISARLQEAVEAIGISYEQVESSFGLHCAVLGW